MLSLYPHNQTAYEATMEMLAETGKAAVIHPTGTGKSMIAFKLCEDHPGERILWLGPSTYIYKTQVENLQKVIGGKNSKKSVEKITKDITFRTYAKLMLMTEAEMKVYPRLISSSMNFIGPVPKAGETLFSVFFLCTRMFRW